MTKSFSAGARKRSIVTGPAKQPPSAVTSFPRFLNLKDLSFKPWVSSSNKHDTACFPSSAWLTCCEGWVDKHRKVHWSNFTLSPDTPCLDTTHLNHTNNTNKKCSKQFLSLYHNSVLRRVWQHSARREAQHTAMQRDPGDGAVVWSSAAHSVQTAHMGKPEEG